MSVSDPDSTQFNPNTIFCRFTAWRSCTVVADPDTNEIEFTNCHTPRKFLATSQRRFVCSRADVRALHFTPSTHQHPGGLTIVTTSGKAFVPENASSFGVLRDWLAEGVPDNAPEFATDNPATLWASMVGTMVGILLGTFLARNSGNTQLVIAVITGAVAGAAGGYLLVAFGARVLNADLARPIMLIVIGLMCGLAIDGVLSPWLGANSAITATLVAGGGMIGGMAAARNHSVRRRARNGVESKT
ncbi:MAG: hypothetical protein ACYTGL_11965 [Planctomycetota bacterium]